MLELGAELFGDDWKEQHSKDKKRDLVAWFDNFFVGPVPENLSAELQVIRDTWLPAGFVQEIA